MKLIKRVAAVAACLLLALALHYGGDWGGRAGEAAGGSPGAAARPAAATDPAGASQPAAATAASRPEEVPAPAGARPAWAVLRERMRTDGEGLFPKIHPEGHVTVDLGGRFTHMSAATRDANGRLRIQCFTSFSALDAAVGGAPAMPATPHPNEHETAEF